LLFSPNLVLFTESVVPEMMSVAAEHNGHAVNAPLGKSARSASDISLAVLKIWRARFKTL
jgi:hypothetical protein